MLFKAIPNLLGTETSAAVLDYALANEARFETTEVGAGGAVSDIRVSRRLVELGPYKSMIESKVGDWVPHLIQQLKLTPFEATGFETELVAHEDGAFYVRHIDLFTGTATPAEARGDRLISLVCYLYTEPRHFSGGELRLYPHLNLSNASPQGAIDIVPEHGLGVAFSSWLPHEVLPVSCPSRKFRDARFAINCWVLRRRPEPKG